MKRQFYLWATACIWLLSSCSSTQLVSSWKSPDAPQGGINNVLVLGMMGPKNLELKENLERYIAQEFQETGTNAAPATDIFGPKGFKGLSEEQVNEKVKRLGYNSIMIVSLVDKEKERVYNPGSVYTTPMVVGYNRYYRRYMVVYDRTYTPGYYSTNTQYVLQTEVYSVDSNELIYSGQTRTYDPNSKALLAKSVAKTIVADIDKKGLSSSRR